MKFYGYLKVCLVVGLVLAAVPSFAAPLTELEQNILHALEQAYQELAEVQTVDQRMQSSVYLARFSGDLDNKVKEKIELIKNSASHDLIIHPFHVHGTNLFGLPLAEKKMSGDLELMRDLDFRLSQLKPRFLEKLSLCDEITALLVEKAFTLVKSISFLTGIYEIWINQIESIEQEVLTTPDAA